LNYTRSVFNPSGGCAARVAGGRPSSPGPGPPSPWPRWRARGLRRSARS